MDGEDGPPFFKSWSGAYLFVLVWLAILMALFAVVTRVYT